MRSVEGVVLFTGAVALTALGVACDDTGESRAPSVTVESIAPTGVVSSKSVAPFGTSTGSTATVTFAEPTQRPPTTPTTPTTVATPTVFRPYIGDPDVCVAAAARETSIREHSGGLLRPYALSAGWHRFQIIADPELATDGRWALVGTIPANSSFDSDNWNTGESEYRRHDTLNGWPVVISTSPSGYVDASIDLGGETDAYVRTYRFDLESIRALISGLAVRSPAEPIGFDYAPAAALPGLEVVIDRADEPVDADVAVLECVIEDASIVRIGAITGDPLVQYVTILDQPYPAEIGRIGHAVVSIGGLGRDPGDGPRLSDVMHAPESVWSRLLGQRPPSRGPVDSEG